jgi:hypothetical protein
MADNDNIIPKADRHGNTMLVPIGIVAVFAILIALMFMRTEETAPTPPPPGASQSNNK